MKRAKVSSVYEGRGRKRTREEKEYISRKARIRARARKYGYRSSTNLNPLYFFTTAVMVEGKRDEHEAAMATAVAVQENDDVVFLEQKNIESTQDQASHVNPFCFSTTTSVVEEKRDEHVKKMVTAAAEEDDDDDVIIIEPNNVEKTEEAVVFNPKVVNEGKENIVEDGESGGSEFKAAIEAEAEMITDGTMMEKWEGEGPGPVWWEEQLPLTCTYEEEWMWGSQMGTAASSGLKGKDGRPHWEVMSDRGFANGVEEDKWEEDDDIWNLRAFKDITNNL